jgi:hypothetical protein
MLAVQFEQYNEAKGKKIAYVSSSTLLLILLLAAYFTTFYIQNAVPADVPPIKSDEVVEVFEIDNVEVQKEGGSAGGGTATNDRIAPPAEQSEKFVTQSHSDTKVFSGNSNNQNGHNATNASSTTSQGNNPFGSGGSGGRDGSGKGPFGGIGNGQGTDGEGPGTGSGKARVRVNEVSLPSYDIEFDSNINLKLTINANGDVVSASCIKSKTTCTDQRIINQVISEVMKQVKYKKEAGAGMVFAFYTVQINAR